MRVHWQAVSDTFRLLGVQGAGSRPGLRLSASHEGIGIYDCDHLQILGHGCVLWSVMRRCRSASPKTNRAISSNPVPALVGYRDSAGASRRAAVVTLGMCDRCEQLRTIHFASASLLFATLCKQSEATMSFPAARCAQFVGVTGS